jgi:hypothetical protein
MTDQSISQDLLEILKVLKTKGGTDCTGTCHHRKPGEFHCHTLGGILNISSQGVKNRILVLLRRGLVKRERVNRPDSTPLIRFTVTAKAEEMLTRCEIEAE